MSSASAFFNPVPTLSVPPRERPTVPVAAEPGSPRGFEDALEQTPGRPESAPNNESRSDADAPRRAEDSAQADRPVSETPVETTPETTADVAVAADSEAGAETAVETDVVDDEPVLLSAELVGSTIQVQVALPDIVADPEVGVVGGEPAALPAWLDPFNNQAGLLTISLNTQPLFNGLIEGVASVLPTLTGLAANAQPILATQFISTAPGTTTLTPVLPVADSSTQGQTTNGGDSNASGSAFSSTASNANAVANLNPATSSTAAFTLPVAAEAPTGVNTLLNNDVNAARPSGPGNTNPALNTTLNPIGATPADGGNDAINAARLSRGLNAAVNQQGGNITLRLTPPEMGTVRIQMTMQGGNVSAQFHAETESARTLLTQQLGQLRTSLESQGLSVERLGVQGMNNSSNSSSLQQQNSQSQNQAEADGRSRGGQQQQPGGSPNQGNANPDAQEERARDNLAAARDLFTGLLEETPEAPAETTPEAA